MNTEIYKLQSLARDLAAYLGFRQTLEIERFSRLLIDGLLGIYFRKKRYIVDVGLGSKYAVISNRQWSATRSAFFLDILRNFSNSSLQYLQKIDTIMHSCLFYAIIQTIIQTATIILSKTHDFIPLPHSHITPVHCVKSARVSSYSGPHFPASDWMRRDTPYAGKCEPE